MIQPLEGRRLFAGFDDLLALTNASGPKWNAGDFISTRNEVALVNGVVRISVGRDTGRDHTPSATLSGSGYLRFFDNSNAITPNLYDQLAGQTSFKVKASAVKSVQVSSYVVNARIKLDESMPAAVVYLGDGNDFFRGNSKSNVIYGEKGNDTLYAGGGDDLVLGGEGNDSLFGGSGTDYFTVRSKDKTDREPRDHLNLIS